MIGDPRTWPMTQPLVVNIGTNLLKESHKEEPAVSLANTQPDLRSR